MLDPPNKREYLLIGLFLVVLTLAAFWQVFGNGFVGYDDGEYLTKNPHVQAGLTPRSIEWAFTASRSANWHPLTWISHMLDCRLYGLNPKGHHVTNLLFHIANVLLLFLVFNRMTGYMWRSAFVAALFAIHPLHVESVAWLAERKDVLSTFFWMLTMLAYISYARRPKLTRYLPVILLFALGLMSKPMLVTLPFALLLLDYWPLNRVKFRGGQSRGNKRPAWWLLREKIPLFALSAASSIVTFVVQRRTGAVSSLEIFPLSIRSANAALSYVRYIMKMLWPSNLAVFYPYDEHLSNLAIIESVGAAMMIIIISFLAIRAARSRPYFTMGWFWYLGTLVPVIGIVQVGSQAMADRYTYVPLIGLFALVAWGAPDLLMRGAEQRKAELNRLPREAVRGMMLPAGLSVIMIAVLATCTWFQVRHWKNGITLFKHALACTSENYMAHSALGFAYMGQGKLDKAFFHYAESLRIDPNDEKVHNSIGLVLAQQGKFLEAIKHYNEAIRINPKDTGPYNNLGNALADQGKLDEAVNNYNEALRIKPNDPNTHFNLANVLARQSKLDEAVGEYEEALRLKPRYVEAHYNLGNVLADRGQINEAIAHFHDAIRINPKFAEGYYNLANVLIKRGRINEAISQYKTAIGVEPRHVGAQYNLGMALETQGRLDEAVVHYEEALRIKTRNAAADRKAARIRSRCAQAHMNLGNDLLRREKFDEAIRHYHRTLRIEPRNTEIYVNLAVAFCCKGNYREAWREIQEFRKRGGIPDRRFLEALSRKMPEPEE